MALDVIYQDARQPSDPILRYIERCGLDVVRTGGTSKVQMWRLWKVWALHTRLGASIDNEKQPAQALDMTCGEI